MKSTGKTLAFFTLVLPLSLSLENDAKIDTASRWRVVGLGRPFTDLGLKKPSSRRGQVEQNEKEVESPKKYNFDKPIGLKQIFRFKQPDTDHDHKLLQANSHRELDNFGKVASVSSFSSPVDENIEESTVSIEISSVVRKDFDQDETSEELNDNDGDSEDVGFVYSVAPNPRTKLAREKVLKETSDAVLFSVSSFTINSTSLLVFILLAVLILLYMRNAAPVKEKAQENEKNIDKSKKVLPCSLVKASSKSNICYF